MTRALLALAFAAIAVPCAAADPPAVADLVKQLKSGSPGERVVAAETLGQLGPAAADAAPDLAAVMSATKLPDREASPFEPPPKTAGVNRADVARFLAARDALARIGPRAVPALAGLLDHESGVARGLVAEALGWLGPDAADAVPALAKVLADSNPIVQIYAADALAKIGPKAEAAVPALAALLTDPKTKDPRVLTPGRSGNPKDAATQALIKIGPKGVAAVREKVLPALIDEYKAATPVPWGGPGVAVLTALGPDAAPAIPAVKDYIRRRKQGSDLDPLCPALLKLGPEGYRAFGELLAEKGADRRAMIGSIATSRVYGNQADLAPLVPTLVRALKDDDKAVRNAAASALAWMGEKAPPEAVEFLAAGLADPDADTAYRFSKLGKAGVPALAKALASADPAVRRRAAEILGQVGAGAREALPALRELARGDDAALAVEASATAARVSLDPADAARLARALGDPDPKLRLRAVARARSLGPLAASLQKELAPLLADPDDKVREGAVAAVASLGRDAPEAVAALAKSFPEPAKWGFALNGYGTALGPALKPAVPVLTKALASDQPDVSDSACRLLAQVGPGAKDAVPALVGLLSGRREPYRYGVVLSALEAIGPGAGEAVPVLLTRPLPLRETVLCLGGIGPAAKDAVPALKPLLADPDPDVRLAAAYALARIEGDVAKYRDVFARAMLPPVGGRGGGLVLGVFDRLAPDCPELLPGVVKLFPSLTPHDRGVLVESVARYGPAAKAVVPDLVRMMADEEGLPQYRPIAAALGAIGPAAKPALPGLRKLLDHPDVAVAVAARDAIARIEGKK